MGVIDIRGTHGSGKSYIPHQLLLQNKYRVLAEKDVPGNRGHLGYLLTELDTVIIGRYATDCGGCDGIGNADEICRRVRLFAGQHRHVLLEGILVAHTFKRYNDLANELLAYGYAFCFLNTPLKTCIARVRMRRRRSGNTKELDPANIIRDHKNIWQVVRGKAEQAGHRVVVLDYRDPLPAVLDLLQE